MAATLAEINQLARCMALGNKQVENDRELTSQEAARFKAMMSDIDTKLYRTILEYAVDMSPYDIHGNKLELSLEQVENIEQMASAYAQKAVDIFQEEVMKKEGGMPRTVTALKDRLRSASVAFALRSIELAPLPEDKPVYISVAQFFSQWCEKVELGTLHAPSMDGMPPVAWVH